jgi:hypothetical protein
LAGNHGAAVGHQSFHSFCRFGVEDEQEPRQAVLLKLDCDNVCASRRTAPILVQQSVARDCPWALKTPGIQCGD